MQQSLGRPRLEKETLTCLKESPATVLLGARQTGKTTLAHLIAGRFKQVTVFDLERAAARRALTAPEMMLADLKGLVIIDEVQRMPEVFETLCTQAVTRLLSCKHSEELESI